MPTLETEIPKFKKAAEDARAEAAAEWKVYTDLRDDAVKSGHDLTKSEHFDKLDEANRKYSEKAEEATQAETRYKRALEMELGPEDDPERKSGPIDDKNRIPGSGGALDLEEMFGKAFQAPSVKFTESAEFKAIAKFGNMDGVHFNSEPIEVVQKAAMKLLLKHPEVKTLLTELGAASPGLFLRPDRQPGMIEIPRRQRVMTQLVTVGDTQSDAVDYVLMNTRTNNAAERPEATTTSDTAADAPESGIDFAVAQANVQEIKHFMPATRRSLADVGQLRTIIDQELGDGILERLDTQILNGSGTAPNLKGILNTAGILNQPRGADPRPNAIHKALTLVTLQFFQADSIVMHPTDWENIRLTQDANGNYQFGPPNIAGDQSIWGYNVTLTPAIAAGTALVGAFRRGATLWIREGVQLAATDSHSDWFLRGLIAILALFRAAFAVQRPKAFSTVTGL